MHRSTIRYVSIRCAWSGESGGSERTAVLMDAGSNPGAAVGRGRLPDAALPRVWIVLEGKRVEDERAGEDPSNNQPKQTRSPSIFHGRTPVLLLVARSAPRVQRFMAGRRPWPLVHQAAPPVSGAVAPSRRPCRAG